MTRTPVSFDGYPCDVTRLVVKLGDHDTALDAIEGRAVARLLSVGPVRTKADDDVHELYDAIANYETWPGPFTNPDVPRNLRVVFSAGWEGADVTVVGTNQFDEPISEVFADPVPGTGGAATGEKIFKTVTAAGTVAEPAMGDGVSIGTGDIIGLPVRVADDVGQLTVDATPEAVTIDDTYHAFTPTTTPSDTTYLVLVNISQ